MLKCVTVFLNGFGLRSAGGNSGAQAERRLERSRSATPPLTADGSPPQLRPIHRRRDERGFCGMERASSRGGQGRRADRGKEQSPRWSRPIGKMPRMAEWPDFGTQSQLGKHWCKQIQYVFSIGFTSHKGRNSPPKIRLAREVYAAKVKPAKRCEKKLTRERRWAAESSPFQGGVRQGGIDAGKFLRRGKLPELHGDGLLKFQGCSHELPHLAAIVL